MGARWLQALSGIRILAHYLLARYGTARTLATLQARRARGERRLLKRLTRRYAFYQSKSAKSFQDLPVIGKDDLRYRFAELNAYGITIERALASALASESGQEKISLTSDVVAGLSTGTSGRRGVFLTTERERVRWAGTILARCLPMPIWRPQRVALCLRANNRLYESVVNSRRLQFRYFDLQTPADETARALAEFAPDVLLAPPALLVALARIKPQNLDPAKIISVADILDRSDRNVIESAFKKTLHQIYQATEGFLGATCERGTLHLNDDFIIFEQEMIDAQRFVPVITDLRRESQAMVRYRLGDVLVANAESCACGSPRMAIARVEGRMDEILLLADVGGEVQRFFRSEVITCIETHLNPHGSYQLAQTSAARLELRLSDDYLHESVNLVCVALRALFCSQGVLNVQIDVRRGFKRQLHEKRRRVVCEIVDQLAVTFGRSANQVATSAVTMGHAVSRN